MVGSLRGGTMEMPNMYTCVKDGGEEAPYGMET